MRAGPYRSHRAGPDTIPTLVANSIGDLSQDQVQREERMERLRAETSAKEWQLEEELSRLQESMVAPPLSELLRWGGMLRLQECQFRAATRGGTSEAIGERGGATPV
uniref:Uncharacterized protein n=1 Tax=Nelumbo nucifera TaxID=4432 RepID=A0A822Z7Z5_NELNU|nr:TPA_asm: hypothetical protein HUJ06_015515 [Nelumbo nucifera]